MHDAIRRTAPGETLRLTVNLAGLNRGRTYTVALDARPEPETTSWLARAGRGLALALPLLALACASLLLFKCPARAEAWSIAFVTAGVIASAPLLSFIERIPPGARGFAVGCKALFGLSAPAFLHYLLSVFPQASALDRLDPRIKSHGIAAALAVGLPFAVWALASGGMGFYYGSWPGFGTGATAITWIAVLCVGAYSLWDCATTGSPSGAMKARFVAAAASVAAVPALLHAVFGFRGWAQALALLPLALLPLAFGHALLATRILPLPVVLRGFLRSITVGRGADLSIVAIGGLVGLACADVLAVLGADRASLRIATALSCAALSIVAGVKLHRRTVRQPASSPPGLDGAT